MDSLTITRPDDWHIHLRDSDMLALTVQDAQRVFGRTIVMPNLKPPITTCTAALAYRQRILKQAGENSRFNPLMTLYLTDNTPADEVRAAAASPYIHAVKYYPAGATTNSDAGVTSLEKCYPILEIMAELGLPLLMHGEVTEDAVDIFDREKCFIDRILVPLAARFPTLRMVLEHVTTADAVQFIQSGPGHRAATITVQHLLFNRNDMLVGGIRPHYYCLPILKRNVHQQALQQAAISGNPQFFLGSDSAPHPRNAKESDCGCAGCYTAHAAIELYAQLFDTLDALDKLEGFASHFGADFYGLPRNTDTITLERSPWQMPEELTWPTGKLVPLLAGHSIHWRIIDRP